MKSGARLVPRTPRPGGHRGFVGAHTMWGWVCSEPIEGANAETESEEARVDSVSAGRSRGSFA